MSYERDTRDFFLFFAVLLASLFIFLRMDPMVEAFDTSFHLRYLDDFTKALMEGTGWPDWDAMPYGGAGTAAFRYFAPGAYLVGAFFLRAGFSLYTSMKLVIFLFSFAGSWGMKRFLESFDLGRGATFGAILYIVSPVITMYLFQVFFFQNFCAMILFPWFLFAWNLRSSGFWGTFSQVFFLVIIGYIHLPCALIAGYVLVTLAILEAVTTKKFQPLFRVLLVFLFSLALLGPYVFPAVLELDQTLFQRFLPQMGPWNQADFMDDLELTADPSRQLRELWTTIRFEFQVIFLTTLFISIPALFFCMKEKTRGSKFLPFMFVGFLLMFFQLRISLPLWRILPGLKVLGSPWRLMWPALVLLLPGISLFFETTVENKFWKAAKGVMFLGCLFFGVLNVMGQMMAKPGINLGLVEIHNIAYYPPGFRPVICQEIDPSVRSGKVREIKVFAGECDFAEKHQAFSRSTWNCLVKTMKAKIAIKTHWDPYWRLRVGNEEILLNPTGNCGLIQADIPGGLHRIELFRVPPATRKWGWLTFFFGILGLFFIRRWDTPEIFSKP